MLSPVEQERLRAQRQAANFGLPMPSATNVYRLTAAMQVSPLRTQTLAIVTVTIVSRSETVMVKDVKDDQFKPFLSTARPEVISVVTNHYDVLRAPEVK